MKKQYQKCITVILMVLMVVASMGFLAPTEIEASTTQATIKYMNVHYTMGPYYGQIGRIYADGLLGLCLEPDVNFLGGNYTSNEMSASKLSESQKQKISMIDYYGKQMNMATDNQVYGAVQLYVWEVITGRNVTTLTGELSMLRFQELKHKINQSIASHAVYPSFHNQTLTINVGETMKLTDTQGVLSHFKVAASNPSVAGVSQTGNSLTVNGLKAGTVTLTAPKVAASYLGQSTLYTRTGSQTFAILKLSDPVNFKMTLKIEDPVGTFELTKFDTNGHAIQDAVFNIDGTQYVTNENGKITVTGIKPGAITYQEISVPKPLIIDPEKRVAVITAGKTTYVSVVNEHATGVFTITKRGEDGTPIEGVEFMVMLDNVPIAKAVTKSNGIAVTEQLPLNKYTIVETSVPDYLILDSTPIYAELVYKNQNTPVVSSPISIENQYKPIVTVGIDKVRIDTKKAAEGLIVEAWFSKLNHYSWDINNFCDAKITVNIVDVSSNKTITQKTYTAKSFPESDSFNISPQLLNQKESNTYEVQVVIYEANKVIGEHTNIIIDGYTSGQETFVQDSIQIQQLYFEGVIRTERRAEQPMQLYYERFQIVVPRMEQLIAGRGFHYDTKIEYSNDLNHYYDINLILNVQNELVDGDWYQRGLSETVIPLEKTNHNLYQVPRVYAQMNNEGTVISETAYENLSNYEQEQYRDGAHQILTPLWSTDLGIYHMNLVSEEIGVHAFNVIFNDSIELYAYMYGWEDDFGPSPTIDEDQVLVSPIYSSDIDGNGIMDSWDQGKMPDNWGVLSDAGMWVLSKGESEFLMLNPK